MGPAQWRALARRDDVLNAHSLGNLSVVPSVFSSTLFCTAALLDRPYQLPSYLQSVQQPPGHSAVRKVLKSIFKTLGAGYTLALPDGLQSRTMCKPPIVTAVFLRC